MKSLRSILAIIFLSFILLGMVSCLVRVHDDGYGRHKDRRYRNNNHPVLIIKGGEHEHRSRYNDHDHH